MFPEKITVQHTILKIVIISHLQLMALKYPPHLSFFRRYVKFLKNTRYFAKIGTSIFDIQVAPPNSDQYDISQGRCRDSAITITIAFSEGANVTEKKHLPG